MEPGPNSKKAMETLNNDRHYLQVAPALARGRAWQELCIFFSFEHCIEYCCGNGLDKKVLHPVAQTLMSETFHEEQCYFNPLVFKSSSRQNIIGNLIVQYALYTITLLRKRVSDTEAETARLRAEYASLAAENQNLQDKVAQYELMDDAMKEDQVAQLEQSQVSTTSLEDSAPTLRSQPGSHGSPIPSLSPSSLRATIARIATISSHTPGARTSSAHCGGT